VLCVVCSVLCVECRVMREVNKPRWGSVLKRVGLYQLFFPLAKLAGSIN